MKITSLEIHPGGFFGGLIPPGADPSPDPDPGPPDPEIVFRSYLDDSSGNENHLLPLDESFIPSFEVGLIPGDGGIGINSGTFPFGGLVRTSISLPTLLTDSWWACGWVDNVIYTSAILFFAIDGGGGFGIAVAADPDVVGNHIIDTSSVPSDSIENPEGPVFILTCYDAVLDEVRFYENGILVSTVSGIGGPGVGDVIIILVGATLTGTTVFDEVAFGIGIIDDSDIANLYAQRGSFSAYSAAQLAMNPVAYYHLSDSPYIPPPDDPGPGFFIYEEV